MVQLTHFQQPKLKSQCLQCAYVLKYEEKTALPLSTHSQTTVIKGNFSNLGICGHHFQAEDIKVSLRQHSQTVECQSFTLMFPVSIWSCQHRNQLLSKQGLILVSVSEAKSLPLPQIPSLVWPLLLPLSMTL